ncbi:NADPH-dependent FMN reductase [Paraflavisolibacter sp. H34]|uniref:NADPH-dependent FMN reductase n=1 Tax=Huijunlia imazamoxiresistens TaxID=3127457 RepID=UPI00301631CF
MSHRKNILAIMGSAAEHSANLRLLELIAARTRDDFNLTIYKGLKSLPHFDPDASGDRPPGEVVALREAIEGADGLIICTPEYVFSLPSGLKNAMEWCVATTVFSGKPTGLITASANGLKGHEELQLIMRTVMARFTEETTLLIQGVKGKINEEGALKDHATAESLDRFLRAFKALVGTAD